MSWTPERIARLERMWGAGCTATVIAREIGVTRNAVIGKTHRLGLLGRPTPIKPAGSGKNPGNKRKRRGFEISEPAPANVVRLPVVRESAPPTPRRIAKGAACQWLNGERPSWVKCGAPAAYGSSWCEGHYHRVFQPAPPKRTA